MRKGVFVINFVLAVVCFILLYKIQAVPIVDSSIFRNEITFYHALNQGTINNFRRWSYELAEDVKDSRHPRMISCGTVAKSHADLFENCARQFKKAYQVKASTTLLTASLDSISNLNRLMISNCREYFTFDRFNASIGANQQNEITIRGINILKQENENISKYFMVTDYLLRECTVPFCGFQTFEGFLATDLNPKWTNPQIDLNIPVIMSKDVTERIFITLNKKAVDFFLESLKKDKLIDNSLSNTYKSKIRIISSDFLVEPLDQEEQPTLTSDDTIWEFDLTSKNAGQFNLSTELGLIMHDREGKSICKYYRLPLNTINVQ